MCARAVSQASTTHRRNKPWVDAYRCAQERVPGAGVRFCAGGDEEASREGSGDARDKNTVEVGGLAMALTIGFPRGARLTPTADDFLRLAADAEGAHGESRRCGEST